MGYRFIIFSKNWAEVQATLNECFTGQTDENFYFLQPNPTQAKKNIRLFKLPRPTLLFILQP